MDDIKEAGQLILDNLDSRLEENDNNRRKIQDRINDIFEEIRKEVDDLEDRVNSQIEQKFVPEDERYQNVLNDLRSAIYTEVDGDTNKLLNIMQRAKAELSVKQTYELDQNVSAAEFIQQIGSANRSEENVLKLEKKVVDEWFVTDKPADLKIVKVDNGRIYFTIAESEVERVFNKNGLGQDFKYVVSVSGESYSITHDARREDGSTLSFQPGSMVAGSPYSMKVKFVYKGKESMWSDEVKFVGPEFSKLCVWKECPDGAGYKQQHYLLVETNPRIATRTSLGRISCTIIGNTPIPLNTMVSWSTRILKSKNNDGNSIHIGIAPSDIDQSNDDNQFKCGWYFNCYGSWLYSGLPHECNGKEYGPRKENGQYVHTGDSVGVVMDTTKGDLSFVLNNVNLGVACEGIPLDKPLVPCVLLKWQFDSVELDTSEMKETPVNNFIPVPSNIAAKGTTWDTITLTWDEVNNASFYQIEVDGEILLYATTTNTLAKRGFLADTEHSFRVRTVIEKTVGNWSDVVKGKTLKESFESSWWKELPNTINKNYYKYILSEENPKVAIKMGNSTYCTAIGNAFIPPNKVSSWNIKVLKSVDNDGDSIYVGVAPFNIDQDGDSVISSYDYCRWYFYCRDSTLWSGPPHSYRGKEYGPRKGKGHYVHTGDSVGVVMDMVKGDLSFALNNVILGVAYEGIPLDKPLVPCVNLHFMKDSVEFDTSEVKENIDSSVLSPPNIKAKSVTWDSIVLTWDGAAGASFYQIEMDGNKQWEAPVSNSFVKKDLLSGTEHSFRARTVKENVVSEWSDILRVVTETTPVFAKSTWKECPDYVAKPKKYVVGENNPRIAIKQDHDCCTAIGNMPIPLSTTTSWSIKVLNSRCDDGKNIYVGIAPFSVDQNDYNRFKCGWYFYCYESSLWSGPPHSAKGKRYGPGKKVGQYVHTGNSIGVVADATKGDISFVLNNVNLGVAYEGIPLDKPLVPCVILGDHGDSVELDTSGIKENVDSSVPVPSNITTKSGLTWDSVTLTWDKVSDASFYQIEVDGNKCWNSSANNTYTKGGLLPDTEHSFRVRAVRGNSVSEWGCIQRKTSKKGFDVGEWKKCPNSVDKTMRYSVDGKAHKIATKFTAEGWCTIVGSTSIPLGIAASWKVTVLKSKLSGAFIYIGVAPPDIDQNEDRNFEKCGWYFGCYSSTLWSGPPQDSKNVKYGPRKWDGAYVLSGDTVGVSMDTTKGELSFILGNKNHGTAFEGIPLDKPLVPCVILRKEGDSVELT